MMEWIEEPFPFFQPKPGNVKIQVKKPLCPECQNEMIRFIGVLLGPPYDSMICCECGYRISVEKYEYEN